MHFVSVILFPFKVLRGHARAYLRKRYERVIFQRVHPFPAANMRYVYIDYTRRRARRKRRPTTSPTSSISRKNLHFGRLLTLTKGRDTRGALAARFYANRDISVGRVQMQISTKTKLHLSDTVE